MKKWMCVAGVVLATCLSGQASITKVFQNGLNGYTGTEDTNLEGTAPNTNNGGNELLNVSGTVTTGNKRPGLFRFNDLFGSGPNQIPLDATIESATLTLYLTALYPVGTNYSVRFAPMLKDWTEGSASGVVEAGASCYSARNYNIAGGGWGDGTGTTGPVNGVDYTTTGIVSQTFSSGSVQTFAAGSEYALNQNVKNLMISLQSAPANNFGLISYWGTNSAYYKARSSEYAADATKRPMLTITYTPEPSTLGFLALSGLCLRRGRR